MAALVILVVTLIVSIIGLSSPSFIARSLLLPYRVAHGSGYAGLITSGFVHADVTHMLFNLITYYSFAFRLESVIGAPMFVLLYFSAMLVGGLGTVFKHQPAIRLSRRQRRGSGCSVCLAGVFSAPVGLVPDSADSDSSTPVCSGLPGLQLVFLAHSARQRQP